MKWLNYVCWHLAAPPRPGHIARMTWTTDPPRPSGERSENMNAISKAIKVIRQSRIAFYHTFNWLPGRRDLSITRFARAKYRTHSIDARLAFGDHEFSLVASYPNLSPNARY